jgi:hypothetical protein
VFIGDDLFMTNNRVTLWLSGSVEILIETSNRSWGLQLFMLPSPPLGHPSPIAMNPDKVEIHPEKRGGQGDAPPGLLPPWGREGVILQAAAENKRIETKEDFNRAGFLHLSGLE